MVQDCTGFVFVMTLKVCNSGILTRNGTGLYRITLFPSIFVCVLPNCRGLAILYRIVVFFLLLLATFELDCKGFVFFSSLTVLTS